jgi:hypothetical protein
VIWNVTVSVPVASAFGWMSRYDVAQNAAMLLADGQVSGDQTVVAVAQLLAGN